MKDVISGIMKYDVFQEKINMELFYAMLSLSAHLSEKKEALRQWSNLVHSVIWWEERRDYKSYLKGLCYPGEVLERYEEHFGSGPENLRAVALALGYAVPFLTPSMFNGRQKEMFLKKLAREAGEDIYLLGARYLLETDASVQQDMLDKMCCREYVKTEEVIFVLSLHRNHEKGFLLMQAQLARLLGKEHTMSLIKNAGVIEWLTEEYGDEIRKCRKKDCAPLKALTRLAFERIAKGTRLFSVLFEAGYSREEIAYINSVMVWSDKITGKMYGNGITAEKIAAECCVVLINSSSSIEHFILSYMEFLLKKYKKFDIKYDGNSGIVEAIKWRLVPVLPQTVLWLLQKTKITCMHGFRFDVFDSQWDILQKNLEVGLYYELFTWQLVKQERLTADEAGRWLERYFELTERDYVSEFQNSWVNAKAAFASLTDLGVIDLWEFFEKNKQVLENGSCYPSKQIEFLWGYIEMIANRKSYEFFKKFFEKYAVTDIKTYFGCRTDFSECMIQRKREYTYGPEIFCIRLSRDFLSEEEHRQLFEWTDEAVFKINPQEYERFAVGALKNERVRKLYPVSVLKPVFKNLLKSGIVNNQDAKELKEFFFTKDEIEEEASWIKKQEEEKKRKEEEELLNTIKQRLTEKKDGTFSSLESFLEMYRWSGKEAKLAYDVSFEYFRELTESVDTLETKEFSKFLDICSTGIRREYISCTAVLQLLEMVIRRECHVADA